MLLPRECATSDYTDFKRSATGSYAVDPRLKAARPAVLAAQQDLRDCAAVRDSGAYLEDKQYAVAIHTRRVANPDRWAAPIDQAARQIAERHGLEVILGKQVWELRPAGAQRQGRRHSSAHR